MSINNIKLIDINKNLQKKVILNNINLEFNKGKIVGIIGANGSGKSSLFKVLSGLWNFDSGKILFDEIEITENKNFIRKNIGAFIENPNFYEDLNALQNFEIIKKLYNIRNE